MLNQSFVLTWTLAPFSEHGGLPPVVAFDYQGDTVYLSEVMLSQLLPNGSGFGTFEADAAMPVIQQGKQKDVLNVDPSKAVDPGWTLR